MIQAAQLFSCQRCGSCCHGDTTVSLSDADQKRMAGVLKISAEDLRQKYLRISGATVQMKTVNGHCIFYDNGCQVHAGRPWRCAQWPLHPAILADMNNYLTIAESCPGINKTLPAAAFRDHLEKLLKKSEGRAAVDPANPSP